MLQFEGIPLKYIGPSHGAEAPIFNRGRHRKGKGAVSSQRRFPLPLTLPARGTVEEEAVRDVFNLCKLGMSYRRKGLTAYTGKIVL